MTSHEIMQADLLDIIFEQRNKQYGAYALRKNYGSQMNRALALTFASVLLLLFIIQHFHSSSSASSEKAEEFVVVDRYIPTEKIKQTPPEPKPKVVAARQEKLTTNIVIVKHTDDPLLTQDDLVKAHVGIMKVEGPDLVPDVPPTPPMPAANGTGQGLQAPTSRFEALERQPEFPGGMQAWINFLSRYLQVPGDLEPGEKKTAMVRFQVAGDGTVTNFEIIQSAGEQFDREVIRVLKKMPRWSPAIQNGHNVSVSFTQPVTFVGPEQ
jgi:protein TonB